MIILLISIVFVLVVIIIPYYKCKIRHFRQRNKVYFYVARDKYNNTLYLYLGKPHRDISKFTPSPNGCIVETQNFFYKKGLNPVDFNDLKWEDEPVEVFLNMKD